MVEKKQVTEKKPVTDNNLMKGMIDQIIKQIHRPSRPKPTAKMAPGRGFAVIMDEVKNLYPEDIQEYIESAENENEIKELIKVVFTAKITDIPNCGEEVLSF